MFERGTMVLAIVVVVLAIGGCASDGDEEGIGEPTETPVPTATSGPYPTSLPTPTATLVPVSVPLAFADKVFFNGTVITVEEGQPTATAIAIKGNEVLRVGSDAFVLEAAGEDTQRIDLAGLTMMPGFVDPHIHPFAEGGRITVETFERGQRHLLSGGVTTMGEAHASPGRVEQILGVLDPTELRVRVSLYLGYNTKCSGFEADGWFAKYTPVVDPAEMLRVPGIKLMGDPAGYIPSCGVAAMSIPRPEGFAENEAGPPFGDLILTEDEIAAIVAEHQALGYQVIIHARGDATVEAALNGIEKALGGRPNVYRHRIEHNDYVRPDQMVRYGELGVIPTLRGRPIACAFQEGDGLHPWGEPAQSWFRVGRSFLDAAPGLPIAWHSDTPFESRHPILDLHNWVTKQQVRDDGSVCMPPPWLAAEAITVEEALRLMTINGAYALFMDEKVGSLKQGKFADIIALSDDPRAVDPNELKDIEVLLTMVGGTVEHCSLARLCPGS